MARTRPIRAPSQPNRTPPVAAPTKKPAVITLNHRPTTDSSVVLSRSLTAGRPIIEKMPISAPSNNQPSSAAARAIHLPALEGGGSRRAGEIERGVGAAGVSRRAMRIQARREGIRTEDRILRLLRGGLQPCGVRLVTPAIDKV